MQSRQIGHGQRPGAAASLPPASCPSRASHRPSSLYKVNNIHREESGAVARISGRWRRRSFRLRFQPAHSSGNLQRQMNCTNWTLYWTAVCTWLDLIGSTILEKAHLVARQRVFLTRRLRTRSDTSFDSTRTQDVSHSRAAGTEAIRSQASTFGTYSGARTMDSRFELFHKSSEWQSNP